MTHRHLAILLIFALASMHCAREVIIDLPDEPRKAVIISHFNPDEVFRLKLLLSQAVHESGSPPVPAWAEVRVSANGEVVDQLQPAIDGVTGARYWEGQARPVPGTVYTLQVRLDEADDVRAQSAVPFFSGLDPIVVQPDSVFVEELPDGQRRLRVPVRLTVTNLPAENRFFAFKLRHQIDQYTDTTLQEVDEVLVSANTPFSTDGRTFSLLHGLDEPVVLIHEKYWSDDRNTVSLDVLITYQPPLEKPTRLFVEWRTLSPEFYYYHLSIARQSGAPPVTDPDAVYNNVDGGYGNFSGYSVRVDTIALPD